MSSNSLYYKVFLNELMPKYLEPEIQESDLDPSGPVRVVLHLMLVHAVWTFMIQQSGRRTRLPTRATLLRSKAIACRLGDPFHDLVFKELREWGIPETYYEAVEEGIAQTLRKAMSPDSGRRPRGGGVKRTIHIQIGLARIQEINEYYDGGMARALRESAQEEAKPVPAAESGIEALERLRLIEEDCCRCAVCLEDVEAGTQAIRMPCNHVYHEDCIVKWLRTSHFCPLCRYELPVHGQ